MNKSSITSDMIETMHEVVASNFEKHGFKAHRYIDASKTNVVDVYNKPENFSDIVGKFCYRVFVTPINIIICNSKGHIIRFSYDSLDIDNLVNNIITSYGYYLSDKCKKK